MFLKFKRTKCGINTITSIRDMEGFESLNEEDQVFLRELVRAVDPVRNMASLLQYSSDLDDP